MNHDIRKNVIIGCCPVCHGVIRVSYHDKVHKVGYCEGCGLEYGNPTMWKRYGAPRKTIKMWEVRMLLDDAYNQLSITEPYLEMQRVMNMLDLASKRTTGYGCPDITRRMLKSWGYDVVNGILVKQEGPGR